MFEFKAGEGTEAPSGRRRCDGSSQEEGSLLPLTRGAATLLEGPHENNNSEKKTD